MLISRISSILLPLQSRLFSTMTVPKQVSTTHPDSNMAHQLSSSSGLADSTGSGSGARLVTDKLDKSSLDTRLYRVVRLANDLEVMLVHDAKTDKASASIDVEVGNFSHEPDMPGMAHAVEHVSVTRFNTQ